MIIRPRAIATTAIAVLVAAGPTACRSQEQPPSTARVGEPTGFRDLPVEDILELAAEDMREARSVRINGHGTYENRSISLDLGIDAHGNCAGRIMQERATVEIIAGPQGTFFKGDAEFWEEAAPGRSEAIQARVGDKWVKVADGEDADSVTVWCDLDRLADLLADDLEDDDSDDEKSQTALIDGQSALRVTRQNGGAYVWVAVESPHYVLWTQYLGMPGESMRFLDYDEPVDTTPPPRDEYVDFFAEAV